MTETTTADIEVKRADGIQTLRFNRAKKKNALTGDMYLALSEALISGDNDPDVGVHVFAGSGGIFTAGNDIKEFVAMAQGGSGLTGGVLQFLRMLPIVKKPMIAAIDGAAIGIGTTMLFHCDLVYATERSSFATPFLDLGLVPEAASSLLMPQRMGYARAADMILLGTVYTAEMMHNAGVINAILPAEELEPYANAAAAKLAKKPPAALALARRLMRGQIAAIDDAMVAEIGAFAKQMTSPEAREAFQAFLEKRPPDFTKVSN